MFKKNSPPFKIIFPLRRSDISRYTYFCGRNKAKLSETGENMVIIEF